jgi:hypothetical protein
MLGAQAMWVTDAQMKQQINPPTLTPTPTPHQATQPLYTFIHLAFALSCLESHGNDISAAAQVCRAELVEFGPALQ